MIRISKTFKADIAHMVITQHLPADFRSKCKNLHGHTVHIVAELEGSVNHETRMVLDYSLLKSFKNFIDIYIDHKFIAPLHLEEKFEPFITAFETFYKENGIPLTWNDTRNGSVYAYDGRVYAKIKSTMSFLNTPSTTAEDMCVFLNEILHVCLLQSLRSYSFVNIDSIVTRIRFSETEGSEAVSTWKSLRS